MFCPKCGNSNTDGAKFCTVCGTSLATQQTSNNEAKAQPTEPKVQQNADTSIPEQPVAPKAQQNIGYSAPAQQNNSYTAPKQATPNVQYVKPQEEPAQKVPNFMTFSIINTILWFICCNPVSLILGIVAIVKSSAAKKLTAASNFVGAAESAKTAKMLNIVALILGVVGGIAYSIIVVFAFLNGAFGSM